MALVTLDTARFDRLRKTRVGFVRGLSRATGLTPALIYRIRSAAGIYGCTPKGQANLDAINKAMRALDK